MASAPQPNLPLFYNDLMPLNSRDHAQWRSKSLDSAKWLIGQHAIPLTVDEFVQAQRDYPIVFSSGDNPLPLALMGLNEGVNTFVDDEGKVNEPVYLPAYIRRYPFMLAKLQQNSDELSLCFDPTTDAVGEFKDGEAQKHELLMDGEIAISTNDNPDTPYIYRGFQMVNQEKLREVRGDVLRGWNQSGLMALIYAHLFSLDLMRSIFARQQQQGKGPQLAPAPAPAAAN
jgi:hypothetical protein